MLQMFKFAILFFSVVMKYGQSTVLYRPHDTFTSSVAPIFAARHADFMHIDAQDDWHAAGINVYSHFDDLRVTDILSAPLFVCAPLYSLDNDIYGTYHVSGDDNFQVLVNINDFDDTLLIAKHRAPTYTPPRLVEQGGQALASTLGARDLVSAPLPLSYLHHKAIPGARDYYFIAQPPISLRAAIISGACNSADAPPRVAPTLDACDTISAPPKPPLPVCPATILGVRDSVIDRAPIDTPAPQLAERGGQANVATSGARDLFGTPSPQPHLSMSDSSACNLTVKAHPPMPTRSVSILGACDSVDAPLRAATQDPDTAQSEVPILPLRIAHGQICTCPGRAPRELDDSGGKHYTPRGRAPPNFDNYGGQVHATTQRASPLIAQRCVVHETHIGYFSPCITENDGIHDASFIYDFVCAPLHGMTASPLNPSSMCDSPLIMPASPLNPSSMCDSPLIMPAPPSTPSPTCESNAISTTKLPKTSQNVTRPPTLWSPAPSLKTSEPPTTSQNVMRPSTPRSPASESPFITIALHRIVSSIELLSARATLMPSSTLKSRAISTPSSVSESQFITNTLHRIVTSSIELLSARAIAIIPSSTCESRAISTPTSTCESHATSMPWSFASMSPYHSTTKPLTTSPKSQPVFAPTTASPSTRPSMCESPPTTSTLHRIVSNNIELLSALRPSPMSALVFVPTTATPSALSSTCELLLSSITKPATYPDGTRHTAPLMTESYRTRLSRLSRSLRSTPLGGYDYMGTIDPDTHSAFRYAHSNGYASRDYLPSLINVRDPVGLKKHPVKGKLGFSSPSAIGYLPRKYRTCDANGIDDNGFITVLVKISISDDWKGKTLLFSPGAMMERGVVTGLVSMSGEDAYRFEFPKGMSIAQFVVPDTDGNPVIRFVAVELHNNNPYLKSCDLNASDVVYAVKLENVLITPSPSALPAKLTLATDADTFIALGRFFAGDAVVRNRGVVKHGKAGERYPEYSRATNISELISAGELQTARSVTNGDFVFDHKRGHVRFIRPAPPSNPSSTCDSLLNTTTIGKEVTVLPLPPGIAPIDPKHAYTAANRNISARRAQRVLCQASIISLAHFETSTRGFNLTDRPSKLTREEGALRGIATRSTACVTDETLAANNADRRIGMINIDFHGPFAPDVQGIICFWSYTPSDDNIRTIAPVREKKKTFQRSHTG